MARDDTDKFVHTKRHFGSDDPNIFKKGVYPYEYVTGTEILMETRLPPREVLQRTERGRNLGGRLRSCIGNVAALRL